ncbi:MAG: hypothetical protein ACK5LS_05970 [Propioniciclava sp.]
MLLIAVGVTYRLTSADVIADLGRRTTAVVERLTTAGSAVAGIVPLATCNRFELYLETRDFPAAVDATLAALSAEVPSHHADVEDGFTVWAGRDAATHVFEVATGLDSMVVGEAQITGQVRSAFRDAQATLTPALARAGAAALAAARSVGRSTDRAATGRSVASAGLDLALPPGETPTVLVIGTGRFAHVVVTDLVRRGLTAINVYSRTDRAEEFARTHPVHPVGAESLTETLIDTDLVVACGGHGDAVLTPGMLPNRSQRPLTLLDLTGSSDIDPGVGLLDGVRVLTLDDVGRLALNTTGDHSEATQDQITAAVDAYLAEELGLTAAATVSALRDHVTRLADAELLTVRGRYPPEIVEAMARSMRRFTGALLHHPTVRATTAARTDELHDYQEALRTVFGIEVGR